MKAADPTSTSSLHQGTQDCGPDFDELDTLFRTEGPAVAIERLIETLEARQEYRALLDALLLKARHELELPLIQSGPLSDLQEPIRTRFEEKYVEAIRRVGTKLLEAGEIP